ncbi:UNVERIFIED_CONTAM: hypothetical protein GTU68_033537 [Idotea baltica]|nr:hypothetical protein [Idotea baltica]
MKPVEKIRSKLGRDGLQFHQILLGIHSSFIMGELILMFM